MKNLKINLNDIIVRPIKREDLAVAATLKAENTQSPHSFQTVYNSSFLELKYEWMTHDTNVVVAYDKNNSIVVGVSERKNYRSTSDLTRHTYLDSTLDQHKAEAIERELSVYGLELSKKPKMESVKAGVRQPKNK